MIFFIFLALAMPLLWTLLPKPPQINTEEEPDNPFYWIKRAEEYGIYPEYEDMDYMNPEKYVH